MSERPYDTIELIGNGSPLSFVETTIHRFDINPPIDLVDGRRYRISVYRSQRLSVEELLSDGWRQIDQGDS